MANQAHLNNLRNLRHIFSPQVENIRRSRPVGPEGRQEGNVFVAYDSPDMRIEMRQRRFVQMNAARVFQVLFVMHFIPGNQNNLPLVVSLLPSLEYALVRMIRRVKSQFAQTPGNLIWVTVVQDNIQHGLNTFRYYLDTVRPEEICQRILTMSENYLWSNQLMRLDDSFQIMVTRFIYC